VGDAAHIFTPTGGLGMNSGIFASINLAWKLAAAYGGWGGVALPSTYSTECQEALKASVKLAYECSRRLSEWPVVQDDIDPVTAIRVGEIIVSCDMKQYEANSSLSDWTIPASTLCCGEDMGLQLFFTIGKRIPGDLLVRSELGKEVVTLLSEVLRRSRLTFSLIYLRGVSPDHHQQFQSVIQRFQQNALKMKIPLTLIEAKAAEPVQNSELALVRPDWFVTWQTSVPHRVSSVSYILTEAVKLVNCEKK